MADGKRGRPRDSDEMKAAKMRLRAASTVDAKIVAQAEIDAIKAREKAARTGPAPHVHTEDELFALLVQHEPRMREAEEAKKQAADREKAERRVLAAAFGGIAMARKWLHLFRRARTDDGLAEARAILEMHQRMAELKKGSAPTSVTPEMSAAA